MSTSSLACRYSLPALVLSGTRSRRPSFRATSSALILACGALPSAFVTCCKNTLRFHVHALQTLKRIPAGDASITQQHYQGISAGLGMDSHMHGHSTMRGRRLHGMYDMRHVSTLAECYRVVIVPPQ